ncbi:hypothetical protein [Bacillus cihuensis]|uniref:hypothetical protein n=1 Tax=Bacillus cihuensis TaxID=1208599 RepID=UPI00040C247F|nr:hypothetical protein [Bacillus cihuensis]
MNWIEILEKTIPVLTGTLAGGGITYFVTRSNLKKQNKEQIKRETIKESKEDNLSLNIIYHEIAYNVEVLNNLIKENDSIAIVNALGGKPDTKKRANFDLLADSLATEKYNNHDSILYKLGKDPLLYSIKSFYNGIDKVKKGTPVEFRGIEKMGVNALAELFQIFVNVDDFYLINLSQEEKYEKQAKKKARKMKLRRSVWKLKGKLKFKWVKKKDKIQVNEQEKG